MSDKADRTTLKNPIADVLAAADIFTALLDGLLELDPGVLC